MVESGCICISKFEQEGGVREEGQLKDLRLQMEKFIQALLVLLLSLMLGVTILQVMMRYLPVPINVPWTEEVARFLNVWLTFLGAAYIVDRHIAVDAFVERMPPKARKYVLFAGSLIGCFYFGFALWGATIMAIVQARLVTPTARISMAFFYIALVICSLSFIIYNCVQAVKLVKRRQG